MKTRLSLLCLMLFALSIIAQSPEKMSYQAIIFNSNNNIVVSQNIGMKVSLIKSSIDGTIVYTETHSLSSNANGMVSLEIGTGTTSDDFSSIDWSDGPYFIKTETDPTQAGGTDYSITGITQLLSVPYALYAKTAGSVTESDPVFSEAAASNISNEDISNWNNKISTESDPLFSDAVASGITTADTINWNNKLDTESDPLFSEAVASGITSTDTTNWNNKISTENDPLFSDAVASGITTADTSNWNNKLDTESDPVFTAWDKDYADLTNTPTIVNSQWTTNGNDIYYNTGNIGIGTETPNGSAILDLSSTSKGFLPPRLTTSQRDAITGITPGLLIFNTTDNKLQSVTPSDGLTLDQSNEVYYTYSTMNYQSFTAGTSGKLSKVSFRISNPKSDGTGTVKLFIYEGEKIEGGYLVDGDVLLGESAPVVPIKDYTTWCDFDLSSLDINLSSGQVYTMKLLPSVEEMTWIAFDNSNAYAGGRSKISSNWDLLFKTYMEGYAWTNVQATSSNSSLSQGKLFIGNASNEASEQSITGDVTISETGVASIGSSKVSNDMLAGSISNDKLAGSITNDKLAGSITDDKLAIAQGKILIGSASGTASEQEITGDVTISEVGVTAIGSGKVTNDMLAGSISNDKLSHPSPWTTDDTKLSYSSGNVGIGTSAPTAVLDVRGAGSSADFRISRDTAAAPDYYTYITAPGDTPGRSFVGVNDSNEGTHVLTMTSKGKLGVNIGNNDPIGALHVIDPSFSLGTSNDITTEFLRNDGIYNPRLQIRHSKAGTDINHTYSTSAGNLSFSIGNVEAMRIDGNRYLGLGTTTPYSKLEVHDKIIAGNGTSTDGMTVLEGRYAQSSNDAINTLGTMYSSGAWLMGFGMRPKTDSYGYLSTCDNSNFQRVGLELSSNFFQLLYAPAQTTTTGSDVTDLTTPLYVDLDDTKVGIGTTTPAEALDVNGVALSKFEGFSYYTTETAITANSWQTFGVPTLEYNTFSGTTYNTSTSAFTAPRSGFYRFSLFGYIITGTDGADKRYAYGIQINGTLKSFAGGNFSTYDTPACTYSVVTYLSSGDVVKPTVFSSMVATIGGSVTGHQFYFQGEFVGK